MELNISHTDGWIAISNQNAVDVDVEHLSREYDNLDIARHYFSKSEYENLCDLQYATQRARFLDLWALKEAYIKACGMGLSLPSDCFGYSFSETGKISIDFDCSRDDCPEHWEFWQLKPSKLHVVAVATKPPLGSMCTPPTIEVRDFIPLAHMSARCSLLS